MTASPERAAQWWIMKITPERPRETARYFVNLFGPGRPNVIGWDDEGAPDVGRHETYNRFWTEYMQIGDRVVILEGVNRVHGVVEIVGPPSTVPEDQVNPEADWFRKRRAVRLVWKPDEPFETEAVTNQNCIIPANPGGVGRFAWGAQEIVACKR